MSGVVHRESPLILKRGERQMKLTMLYKDTGSGQGSCPAVYLGETGEFVVQGQSLDAETFGELANVLEGETAVRISSDVILGAVERFRKGNEG